MTDIIIQNKKTSENVASEPERDMRWTLTSTKLFLDLYKEKKEKVGTLQTKTIKIMWKQIAEKMQNLLNIKIEASQCENRWRVVERGYKKFVDNQTSTGRGKKFFEYQEEMEDILGKKKNVYPEVLLESDTIDLPHENEQINVAEVGIENVPKTLTSTKRSRKRRTLLESLSSDRKKYYEERIAVEKEKVEQMRIRNELIRERNSILKERQCNCNM